jgi:poly(3-hydroxybutyrate) depolymerase
MHNAVRTMLLALAGCVAWLAPDLAGAQPATRPTRPGAAQSQVERKTYDFKETGGASKQMEYALFVPSGYDQAKKTPLVVALHGLYSNPQQIMHYPGMTNLAEKYGYIVVAPMGYNNRGWYGAKSLVRGPADDPMDLSDLSEQDVMNVLDLVRKAYNIDPGRIYLLGHSMGGGGAFELGIKHPELWAALAPIAPATSRPATDAEVIKRLPVILVQGDRDVLVKVERVRPWADEMKKLGMDYEYDEIAGGNHISVAFESLPKIFAFFDRHKRGENDKGAEK